MTTTPPNVMNVRCPKCKAGPNVPCFLSVGSTHKDRKRAARAGICTCTNHLGTPKAQHRNREDAVNWCIRGAARRDLSGMTFEPYPCPNTDRWHIRTKRAPTATPRREPA